jgi:hypothetical protein
MNVWLKNSGDRWPRIGSRMEFGSPTRLGSRIKFGSLPRLGSNLGHFKLGNRSIPRRGNRRNSGRRSGHDHWSNRTRKLSGVVDVRLSQSGNSRLYYISQTVRHLKNTKTSRERMDYPNTR